jgi:Zn-finger nucleic acid-binding protein
MVLVGHAGTTVDHCPFCEGLWFDGSELDKLLAGAGRPHLEALIPPRGASALTCPRCKPRALITMAAAGWSGIVLERCPTCRGLFVDAPEFRSLIREGAPTGHSVEQTLQAMGRDAGTDLLSLEGFWYFLLSLLRKR